MFLQTFGPEHLLEWGVHPLAVIFLLPAVIIASLLIVRIGISRMEFVCTECRRIFRPKFRHTHIGTHDDNGREQYCPHCRKITFCRYSRKDG